MQANQDLTSYLSGGLGAYLLLSAVGFLFPAHAAAEFVRALRESRAVAHLTGAVAFFVGGAILVVHFRFDGWREALVSLTAIWWTIEGALMLAASELIITRPDAAKHLRRMNVLAIPVGVALLVAAVIGVV